MSQRERRLAVLLAPGIVAFLIAALSVADMFLPRPYDGVILESDAPGARVVRQVVEGSGADRAGIRPGDIIVGIDRQFLNSTVHAQELLNRHRFGEEVPYLIRSRGHIFEVDVELGRRQIGDTPYLFACILGFLFFVVGTFVVVRQPRLPAARVFATMCSLFLLFLVCRLRPASYSWVDSLVLTTGTVALLLLPGAFLHFFLIFPRPIWEWRRDPIARTVAAIARVSRQLMPVYLIPPAVYAGVVGWARWRDQPVDLISGAPAANWWVMVAYMTLGLGALGTSAAFLPDVRQRRGAGLVFVGTVFGVVPFMLLAVAFPSFLHTERFMFTGVMPLVLVPITFAYAIVRFGLMDIRVILRKSLLYTITTAVVTAVYALGIASFNWAFSGTRLADSPWFPVVFALAIVLLFEPLRHRVQGPVDRFFFAERLQLQRAMVEMGEAFASRPDLGPVVTQLVQRLPALLKLHFAALYLIRGRALDRVAGPEGLPDKLPALGMLFDHLARRGALVQLADLAPLRLLSAEVDELCAALEHAGVEMIGLLATTRRRVGLVLLSDTTGQTGFEREEEELLEGLMRQASIALETSVLLDERAAQAELERELKIAAAIQTSLLPPQLRTSAGWEIAAVCRPAREVGGDFFTELPSPDPAGRAVAYGDVSGKSISGALMMMAAHEVLHALALAYPDPEELLRLANERLYRLRSRGSDLAGASFVALGWLGFGVGSDRLQYALAGQPPPVVRRAGGDLEELALPPHRLPLGAMRRGGHQVLETRIGEGDVILAYSDGLVEAQTPEGEPFGEQRLMEVIRNAPWDPSSLLDHLVDTLRGFTRGHLPYDDITLIAARRETGAGGSGPEATGTRT